MHRIAARTFMALLIVTSSLAIAPSAPAAFIAQTPAPPGQINITTINAAQNQVIGVERFEMLLELARSVLRRPFAFDSGQSRIGAAPDVIVIQEMSETNLEIFEKLIRQRSDFDYNIAGSTRTHPKFIINSDRVTMQGTERVWTDPCYASFSADDSSGPRIRTYQWAEFLQTGTNAPFAVAGVHFDKDYQTETGQENCLERNVAEVRRQLEATSSPTLIAGDFNRRAVETQQECDVEEQSAPLQWYTDMTAPAQGKVYTDAVKSSHAEAGSTLADEWSHEQKLPTLACDASSRFRRTRIDYMFTSGMDIAEAHADHPGWAGEEPGSRNPAIPRYSDHRFVAGRFQITGPVQPPPVTATPAADGRIQIAWTAPETPVTGWVLYRAIGDGRYTALTRLAPELLAYEDFATEHGRTYRYALAAIDAAGAQSIESTPAFATADARGPLVRSRTPGRNATGIELRTDITARFDEAIDPESVFPSTINVYSKGRRVCGQTEQIAARILVFDPCFPLARKREYRVTVFAVRDRLGNRGVFTEWRFTTR